MIIEEILTKIPYNNFIGNKLTKVTKVVDLETDLSDENAIRWVNSKNLSKISQITKGTVICPLDLNLKEINKEVNYILSENPRESFRQLMILFENTSESELINYKNAWVDKNVIINETINLGIGVVIEKDVKIGNNVKIGHHTVIKKGTIIKNNVTIGCNCTIGGEGFGYEKTNNNNYNYIPHIGNVVISEFVEIGNNTCIDKAVLGSTYIGDNVKIDNLVHIAHGVKIEKNSLIIANAMIAGSVRIGENCWIAPSASILNKVSIGNKSLVGLGAVVLKDVPNKTIVAGNPSKVLKSNE
jgi:UDP-3-O-[3-hydroxymyristoyl] glucosamine N-acyltransferase